MAWSDTLQTIAVSFAAAVFGFILSRLEKTFSHLTESDRAVELICLTAFICTVLLVISVVAIAAKWFEEMKQFNKPTTTSHPHNRQD